MTVVLVSLVVLLLAVAAASVVVLRRRRTPRSTEPLDRSELQARQQALGDVRRPNHGYGADRTYGGGGPF